MAADAASFFGKPFDEGSTVTDFGTRFIERLALFKSDEQRQILEIFDHQGIPALEQNGAFGIRFLLPRAEGGISCVDRRPGLGCAHVGNGAEIILSGGIDDVYRLARRRTRPDPVDQSGLLEKVVVVQIEHIVSSLTIGRWLQKPASGMNSVLVVIAGLDVFPTKAYRN